MNSPGTRSAVRIPWMLVALIALGVGLTIAAAPASPAVTAAPVGVEARVNAFGHGLGQLTGLAVSPLWVLALFGAIDWFNAAPDQAIPLHASPWVWGGALLVASLAMLTSVAAGALPAPARKVVGAADYLEEQVSGLIAGGIFIPTLATTLEAAGLGPTAAAAADSPIQAGIVGGLGAGALATVVFLIVRIVSLTVDAFIMLSPFVAVDAVLHAVRAAVLGIILGSMAIHPMLALVVCSVLIIGCTLVVGWCIRVNLFAASCMWDILTLRWRRTRPADGPVRAFMATGRRGPAVRTRGLLEPVHGRLLFRWRPWFVLPQRAIEVEAPRSVLVRGIVWSSIAHEEGGRREDIVLLPPRYFSHEETVAGRLGGRVEDGFVRRSIRQTIDFVRGVASLATAS